MPSPSDMIHKLVIRLQTAGPMAGGALSDALDISQPTLSRLIASASDQVVRLGAARSTRYALRRSVRHFGNSWPVCRIGGEGKPQAWAQLEAVHGGFVLTPQGETPAWLKRVTPDGFFPGLPFFLRDLRPQGFMGRGIAARTDLTLGTPARLDQWQEDDALAFLLTEGLDTPGDFILGDRALEAWLRQADARTHTTIAADDRENAYPFHATEATRDNSPGSSVGGEQPKFLASLATSLGGSRSVLVKFTGAEPSPFRQRWADLLACEHIASTVLRESGEPCARTQLLDSGGRRFLEIARFDRVGASGRRELLSLGALEEGLLNTSPEDWIASSFALEKKGLLSAEEAARLRRLACFGDLIGNTDMHKGNISVIFGDSAPFQLAPAYDMLPMHYAPGAQGELAERPFSPRPPLPAHAADWARMAPLAQEFWKRVQADERISSNFRNIAAQSGETVHLLRERFV